MSIQWSHVLRDCIKDNSVRELHLRKIPVLKNCKNWKDVKEIGGIDHKTKYAHYKGLLVRYANEIYYLSEEKMQALEPFRSWDRRTNITVTEIEKK